MKTNEIEGLDEVIENLPKIFASIKLNAELYRVAYSVLIDEGFTEEEALELLKARGPLLT